MALAIAACGVDVVGSETATTADAGPIDGGNPSPADARVEDVATETGPVIEAGIDAGPPDAGFDAGPPVLTGTKETVGAGLDGLRTIAFADNTLLVGKTGISARIPIVPAVGAKQDLPGIDDARALAFANDTIFYIHQTHVGRIGQPSVDVSPVPQGEDLIVASNKMIAVFVNRVQTWNITTGMDSDVNYTPAQDGEPRGVASDGVTIFWADHKKNAILKVLFSGGFKDVTAAYSNVNQATSVAVDGPDLLFTSDGAILRGPKSGGSPTVLANDLGHPLSLAVDDAYVYWVEGDNGNYRRMSKTGGPIATFATGTSFGDLTYTRLILVNAGFVYWAQPADGSIFRIPK